MTCGQVAMALPQVSGSRTNMDWLLEQGIQFACRPRAVMTTQGVRTLGWLDSIAATAGGSSLWY